MIGQMSHPCADRDGHSCSDGYGLQFYRGPDGHGLWLCTFHRDTRREQNR